MTIPTLSTAIPVNIYSTIKNINLSPAVGARVEKGEKNDYMRRSLSTGERLRVPTMNETMQEMMEREKAETIRTLNLANSALSRLFGIEEGEEDE